MRDELVFTAITRFGTVLFTIYIISVLLNVFRYVMRIAAYYEARAQALSLTVVLNEKHATLFAELAATLSAEKIDFGNEPPTPTQQAIELLKVAKSKDKEKD